MQLDKYKIIFKGEICSGHDPEKVKQDIGLLFKLDTNKLTKIFSGTKVTLKKDITHEQAQKYQKKLQSLGLIVYLEQEESAFNIIKDAPEDLRVMSPVYEPPKVREGAYHQARNERYPANTIVEPPAIFSFDFSGRYGRLNYLNLNIIISLVLMLGATILSFIPILGWILGIVILVVLLILDIRIIVLRLHDFNMSGWWFILGFIPIINLILLFMPGTAGKNQYGPVVRRGSFFGLIVCIILPFILGLIAAIMLPMYQDYVKKSYVHQVYQDLSIVKNEVDSALKVGKTPVIGTKTTNPNEYYPIGMAKGNVTKSSSKQANIRYAAVVGLNNTDNNIKIYAVFDEKIPNLLGATISLERQANGAWNCIVYSDKQVGFKTKYLPKSCTMGH